MEKKYTVEDFRDKIKPLPEFEFQKGDTISPEKLASYINKTDLGKDSFYSSGRSERVGDYTLERMQYCKFEGDKILDGDLKFILRNHSFQSCCNENGIIDSRKYIFLDKGEHCECVEIGHEMLAFYDQLKDSGNGCLEVIC